VLKAAAAGDRVGQELIDEMTDEIVVTATAAIRRLHLTQRDVHVVLGGGVVRAMAEADIARIASGIRGVAPAAEIRQLDAPPVLGAALMGLDALRAPKAAQERVRKALTGQGRPRNVRRTR
jgi:N-acetylglucosamine kinase-like BadF-type ATPase